MLLRVLLLSAFLLALCALQATHAQQFDTQELIESLEASIAAEEGSGESFPADESDFPSDFSDFPEDSSDFPSDDMSDFPSDFSDDMSDFPSDFSDDPSDFPSDFSDDLSDLPSDVTDTEETTTDAAGEATPTTTTAAATTTTTDAAGEATTTTTTGAATTTTTDAAGEATTTTSEATTTTPTASATTTTTAGTATTTTASATTTTTTTAAVSSETSPTSADLTTSSASPTTSTTTSSAATTTTVAPTPPTPATPAPPPPPPTPSAPTAAPGALLLVRATLRPPASCLEYATMSKCFVVQLTQCVSWITDPNEVGVYQFTKPENRTLLTNVTFFLVYPQNGELNEPDTRRLLQEVGNGLSCAAEGVTGIRAAAADLPDEADTQSMSTLGVIFGFLIVFAILGGFIVVVLRKRQHVMQASQVSTFIKQLEDFPEEEMICLYSKRKAEEEEERAREEAERHAAEEEEEEEARRQAEEEEALARAENDEDDAALVDEDGDVVVQDDDIATRDAAVELDSMSANEDSPTDPDPPVLPDGYQRVDVEHGADADLQTPLLDASAAQADDTDHSSHTHSVDPDDIVVPSAVFVVPVTQGVRPRLTGNIDPDDI